MMGHPETLVNGDVVASAEEKITGFTDVVTVTVTLPKDTQVSIARELSGSSDEVVFAASSPSPLLNASAPQAHLAAWRAGAMGTVRMQCGRRVFESHPSASGAAYLVPAELSALYAADHPHVAALLPTLMACRSDAKAAAPAHNQLSFSLLLPRDAPRPDWAACVLRVLDAPAQSHEPLAAVALDRLPAQQGPLPGLTARRDARGLWRLRGSLPLSPLSAAEFFLPAQYRRTRADTGACWAGVDPRSAFLRAPPSAPLADPRALARDRAASALALHAAPHLAAFLETAVELGAGAAALDRASMSASMGHGQGVGNEVGGLIKADLTPAVQAVADPLANAMANDVTGALLTALRRHVTEGVSQTVADILEPMLRGEVTLAAVPTITEAVTDAVTKHVAEAVAESVSNAVASPVTLGVDQRLKHMLVPRLAEHLTAQVAAEVNRHTTRTLTVVLPKAIAHSVVPALAQTVNLSPYEHQHCYKCTVENDADACKNCPQDKRHSELWGMAPTTYFALYYTGYYSTYYAAYYSDRFVEKPGVRIVRRRKIDPNDPIPDVAWHVPDGPAQI
jgi:hypothetical protein